MKITLIVSIVVLAVGISTSLSLAADKASTEFDAACQQVLQDTIKIYPEMADKKSQLYERAEKINSEILANTKHPYYEMLFTTNAPRILADLAASQLEAEGVQVQRATTAPLPETPAQEPKKDREILKGDFILAVKNDSDVYKLTKDGTSYRFMESDWRVDFGEVYQFIRWMSTREFNDDKEGSDSDKMYVLVKVGNTTISAKASDFIQISDKDMAQAAVKYNDEVVQDRENEQRKQELEARQLPAATPSPNPQQDAAETPAAAAEVKRTTEPDATPEEPSVAPAIQPGCSVQALNGEANPPTLRDTGGGYKAAYWSIQAGEIYQFVRWLSSGEYFGNQPTNDKMYMVVKSMKTPNTLVSVPSNHFALATGRARIYPVISQATPSPTPQQEAKQAKPWGIHKRFSDPEVERAFCDSVLETDTAEEAHAAFDKRMREIHSEDRQEEILRTLQQIQSRGR